MQIAEHAERVVKVVDVADPALRREPLELELEVGQRAGVDELAQLRRPEELGEHLTVERKRLRAALGEGRVALVHEGGDVAELQ